MATTPKPATPDPYLYDPRTLFPSGEPDPSSGGPAQVAPTGAIEGSEGEILYVDAGKWAGDGVNDFTSRHRDFVVVCGDTVALCSFGQEGEAGTPLPVMAENVGEVDEEAGRINNLLATLNGTPASFETGRVVVTHMHQYQGPHPRDATDLVEVFLPDTHIPVISEIPAAVTVKTIPRLDADDRTIGILSDRINVAGPWALLPDGRSAGRLWYEPTQIEIDTAEAYGLDYDVETSSVYRECADGVWRWVLFPSAMAWFGNYIFCSIFRDAAPDLILFLGRLNEWYDANDGNLQLVQLGDLLELWFGLHCALETTRDRTGNTQVEAMIPRLGTPSTEGFLKDWCGRALMLAPESEPEPADELSGTKEGSSSDAESKYVRRSHNGDAATALRLLRDFPNIALVKGNHDNYLCMKERPSEMIGAQTEPYRSSVKGGALFAEHGNAVSHGYFDEYNCDGSIGYWDLTSVSGNGDPWTFAQCGRWIANGTLDTGHKVANAAFLHPKLTNFGNAATFLGGAWANFRKWGRSLAVYRWKQQGNLAIFVQGHSHEPVLNEMTISGKTIAEPPSMPVTGPIAAPPGVDVDTRLTDDPHPVDRRKHFPRHPLE